MFKSAASLSISLVLAFACFILSLCIAITGVLCINFKTLKINVLISLLILRAGLLPQMLLDYIMTQPLDSSDLAHLETVG